MADDQLPDGDYRTARQLSAGLLIATVVFAVALDAGGIGQVDAWIIIALLITAAGMLAVDLPDLRR